ncbi:MAG TPA: hypothetical protein ENK17_03245 [Anaerolineae bacterium]|nr:hypothetical protein [Anaerolineae bacterium]
MYSTTSPQVDLSRCTHCGLCVLACPCDAVTLKEWGPFFACSTACTTAHDCCCLCEDVCPTGAITWAFEIVSLEGMIITPEEERNGAKIHLPG